MLIDYTYFQSELNIPNLGNESSTDAPTLAVRARLQTFIDKYEPELLRELLGYAFYKVFITGVSTTPPTLPDQRWQDLIYGVEYTSSFSGKLEKWDGLLQTSIPVYSFGSGYIYKQPVYITAGVTPGFNAGTATETFTDWIGWIPAIERIGQGTLEAGVDYTFNTLTGQLQLLTGIQFNYGERFNVTFQLKLQNPDVVNSDLKKSFIANYVYFKYMNDKASFSSAIGEVKTKPATAGEQVPSKSKTVRAWNEMADYVHDLYCYLDSNLNVYPEYDSQIKYYNQFLVTTNVLNI